MKKILLAITFLSVISVTAQTSKKSVFTDAKIIKFKEGNSFPSFVDFGSSSTIKSSNFLNYYKSELKLDGKVGFSLINSVEDEIGITHDRFRLTINSVEVAYSNLLVHHKNGKVISFNSNFKTINSTASEARISEKSALKSALAFVNAKTYQWEVEQKIDPTHSEYFPTAKLMFIPNYYGKNDDLTLAYEFNIYASEPLSRQLIYVNATNGSIVFHESLIHTGGDSKGQAATAYSDTVDITTDSLGQVFRLVDSTRGNGIITLDAQRIRGYGSATDFLDSNNFWNNANTNLDQYAGDAHWGSEVFYDYLSNVHSRNSIDNMGFELRSYIHYDQNYVNAFWNGQFMTYGDGDAMTTPLTTLDIVGHEITHGLTDFTSDLIYANESGALNESFSDIFGTALEFNARPSRANWSIGEDIGGAFRSMSNPNSNGDPDTYGGLNWINQNCIPTANNDRCGVHTNSGVQNYWFYLLATGGSGVNDISDTFNVNAIGLNKAEKIAYRNLTVYLTPSSDYAEARFYGILSAIDLYGACSPEVEATTNAWHAVGVGDPYTPIVSADFTAVEDTAFCFVPANVSFKSEGSNVQSFNWDFGNGQTSTNRLPSTSYLNTGTYTVQLIADGGTCGSDTITKTNYITLDQVNVPCSYLLQDGPNADLTSCTGRLYDSGGFGGDYSNDEEGVVTISVSTADYIQLDFRKLQIEAGDGFNCNKDFIEIYDGPNMNARMIGRYCSNYLPPNNQIISTSNAVTIRMSSDETAFEGGFLISWKCLNSTNAPVAEFSTNVDSTCTGDVKFTNLSDNGFSTATWDFGDGTTSNDISPSHNYYNNGTYTVSLTVQNTIGNNVVLKTNNVVVSKLASPTVNNDTVCFGADAGLKVNNVTNVEWYTDSTAAPIYTIDSLTVNNLRNNRTYYVKELNSSPVFTGGKFNNAGPGSFSSDNDFITFDVFKPILLKNMILFSNKAGIRRLDIFNSNGELVNSKEVYIPSNPLRVNLNMEIYPDSNLTMSISNRNTSLFKNTSGAVYPYNISNLVSIKGSNNAGEYPYFFRWQIEEIACESNFVPISAIIDTSCSTVGLNEVEQTDNSISIHPNPFKNDLTIGLNNSIKEQINIQLINLEGKLVYEYTTISSERQIQLSLQNIPNGIYYLYLRGNSINSTQKVVKIE